jgi:hypothetical protein
LWSAAPRKRSDIVVSHENPRALAKIIGISPAGSINPRSMTFAGREHNIESAIVTSGTLRDCAYSKIFFS